MQPEANIYLMDSLYASAIDDLVEKNDRRISDSTAAYEKDAQADGKFISIDLVPGFVRDPEGNIEPHHNQPEISEEVLDKLHTKWKGTEILKCKVDDNLQVDYWDFVKGFTVWTIVVSRYSNTQNRNGNVVVHAWRDEVPEKYQELKIERERQREKLNAEPQWKPESAPPNVPTRKKRVAKAVGKWLRNQTKPLPPRPNRFE